MLSVIIPSFNEEENILNTAKILSDTLHDNQIPFELIFVNDGSSDHSWEKICAAAETLPGVRGICFSRNFGKEASIFAGLRNAKGDCCVVMDCDLQHPPQTVPQMYALWQQGYEVVEGVKRTRGKESIFHKMSAGLFYKTISAFMGMDIASSSDFKLMDRKVVDALCALPEKSTFFRALSFWVGFRSVKLEYDVAERAFGKTKWSVRKLAGYAVKNLTSFTAAPLYFVTFVGMILLLFSVVMCVQTLVNFLTGHAIQGFTTVILLLLLIGGCIMISLGIIGYYLARIFDEIKGRPQYIISRQVGADNKETKA